MKITGSAAVFPVSNIEVSLKYFTDVLGFTEGFRGNIYAIVERGDAIIHLSLAGNPHTSAPGSGSVYIFCDEADSFYQELLTRNALLDMPPRDYPYGMRDFVVFDPDKNKLCFGCAVKSAT